MFPAETLANARRAASLGLRFFGVAIAFLCTTVQAATSDLTEMSIEDLMAIEVTSVSGRAEKASDAAAAVFVLTRDDIRRAGVTNVPDALRLAPGVEVAQINANSWAITIRGSNSRFSNKLLVLIDGRSIYTPLFSGVIWSGNDVFLDDVERIEVIRGPGATLWGANAVNGVINIITRPAEETQGTFARVTGGSGDFAMAEARQGVMLNENSALRIYAQRKTTGSGQTETGQDANDAWRNEFLGFRSDTAFSSADMMIAGEYQESRTDSLADVVSLTPPFLTTAPNSSTDSGGYVMGRWTQQFVDAGELSLQSWIEHRELDTNTISEKRTTVDVQIQHSFALNADHGIVWGLGYRRVADDIGESFSISFNPTSRTTGLWSGFVQDTISIVDGELDLVLGTKIEHNDYTGTEFQPNARLLWQPDDVQTFWGAVSHAVRTPSRVENDVRVNAAVVPPFTPDNPTPFPLLISFFGSDQVQAEQLTAYELGYRVQPASWVSVDTTAFYNDYSKIVSAAVGAPFLETTPAPTHLVLPVVVNNDAWMHVYGFESVATFQVTPDWRLQGTYGLLEIDSSDPSLEGTSPEQQATLRSIYNVTPDVDWDATLRYVDSLPGLGVSDYLTLDTRIAWRPREGVEIALTGRNLLGSSHIEFGSVGVFGETPAEVDRSVFLSLSVRF